MTRILCTLIALLAFAAPVHAQATGPWARVIFGSDAGPFDTSGTSSPENVVIACPGSTFRQTDGTAGNVFWVKDGATGCDATGWVILAGGGGGGSHNLLSATHSDTTPDAVVRGTVIVGQAGPIFGRLTPTTTGQVLRYNGTDTLWSLDGSLFEDLNASELMTGTVPDARLSANVSLFGAAVDSSEITNGTIIFADWASNSCATNQIPKYNGSAWACAADEDTGGGGGAPADASFLVRTAESGLSNESNLGALTTGLLKITVSAGSATPSTATAGTDYVIPAGNVATATALAANGTNCGAGEFAAGVDASGNAEGCDTPTGAPPAGSDGDIQVKSGSSFAAFAGDACPGGEYASAIGAGGALTCSTPAGGGGGGGGGAITRAFGAVIDGGGSVITTGVKGFIPVPYTGTITRVTVLSTDASATAGSIVVDLWKDTYANYAPTDADSITASAPPTLSSANKSQDSTLTGWTTSVTAGDIVGFNVDSASTVTHVTVVVEMEETGVGGGSAGALVYLGEYTASAAATLDAVTRNASGTSGDIFQSDYDEYVIEILSLVPATNAVHVQMRVSTDSGSTFVSSNDYRWGASRASSGGSAVGGNAAISEITLSGGGNVSNTSTSGGLVGTLRVFTPQGGVANTRVTWHAGVDDGTGSPSVTVMGTGAYASTTAVDALRFFASSGNITGTVRVYGVANTNGSGGGGGGAWSLRWTAQSAIFPASNPATFNTRNTTPVLEFDTTTQEGAYFLSVLPDDYAAGGVTVCTHWAAASATSGTIGWDVAFERIGDSQQDLDADGFGSATTVTATTVPGTSGHVDIVCANVSDGANMDSLAAGDAFRLRVRRDVTNDDAAGDAQLVAVTMKEQ